MSTTPDIRVTFPAKLRTAYVTVDALGWSDFEGIYKTALSAIWFDGVDVISLLSDSDLSELEGMIEDAIYADAEDARYSAFNPARDAFTLGE